MVLTRAAVDLLGKDVTHVQLAYNPKTQAVGIRAADEEAPGCYTLRTQKKTRSRLVGGKRFFKHHLSVGSGTRRLRDRVGVSEPVGLQRVSGVGG